jgi:hypothetical protein
MELKEPLNQFECEATQSVSIGNHNFGDKSFARQFQNGTKAFASEVDPRPNVCDDSMVWEFFLHVRDLPLEIVFLGLGGHSAITD